MLDSAFELLTLAASNSLAVFCFCNLIIGIILVSGTSESKESIPFPSFLRDNNLKRDYVSSSTDSNKVNKEDRLSSVGGADERRPFQINHNDEIPERSAVYSSQKANESIKSKDDDEKSWSVSVAIDEPRVEEARYTDREDDDELRKRIEVFIEKINTGWRDERLKKFS